MLQHTLAVGHSTLAVAQVHIFCQDIWHLLTEVFQ